MDNEGFKNIAAAVSTVEQHDIAEEQRVLFIAKFEKLGPSCKEILGLSWTINEQTGKYNSLKDVAEITDRSYQYVRKKIVECRKRLLELISPSIT